MAVDREKEIQKARDASLKYLSARARSVHEMREKLRQKEISEEVVDQVVADLERLKLLDDREFARNWVESRMRNRPAGALKLAQELRKKGIDKAVIDDLLEEFGEALDSIETATALLRRQKWRYAGLEEVKAKRRMLGFLARRGYESGTVYKAIDKVWEELQRNDLEGD